MTASEIMEEIGLLQDKCEAFICLRELPLSQAQQLEAAQSCIDDVAKRLKTLCHQEY